MNQNNYATLEASKRLQDAGIVLDTESAWLYKENVYNTTPEGDCIREWKLIRTDTILFREEKYNNPTFVIPAPSMVEIWRELPQGFIRNGKKYFSQFQKWNGITYAGYQQEVDRSNAPFVAENLNPTDAIIDLLIWVMNHLNNHTFLTLS